MMSMDIRADWISLPRDVFGAYAKRNFKVDKIAHDERIVLRIVGLGYYRAYLNGQALTTELYSQPLSDYCPRDLSKTLHFRENVSRHTIYYNEFDITDDIHLGGQENTLFCELGCGWFKNNDRNCEGDFSFSEHLMMAFEIVVGDRIVCKSDEETLWHENGVVREGLYTGMTYDFRREPTAEMLQSDMPQFWHRADVVPKPKSAFKKSNCKGDRVLRYITPKLIIRNDDYTVYDCGVNTVGFFTFRSARPQDEISVEYAELCGKTDIVGIYETIENFKETQIDTYLHVPEDAVCRPRFTWYGFRYVKVRGDITDAQVAVIGMELEELTAFNSTNSVLNWYDRASKHSIASNFHMSIPTDCPHREKFPYTGDGQLVSNTAMFNFHIREEYEKWLWDMEDAQLQSGMIPNTVPYFGGGGGPGGWGSACIIIPWNLYEAYGDKSVLAAHLPMMERYIEAMLSLSKNGIVQRYDEDYPFLGDWCYPDSNGLPEEFVNTYFIVKGLEIIERIYKVLGKSKNVRFREARILTLRAIQDKWFDNKTGSFLRGAHAADAYALDMGLGDSRTKKNLIAKYKKMKCFDTGIFGTQILISVLEEMGEYQVIYSLLSSRKYPSFGYWKNQGATSLWENWSGCFSDMPWVISSRNHAMYGAAQKYLYTALAGIDKSAKGLVVVPRRIRGLRKVVAQVQDINGTEVKMTIRNGLTKTRVIIESNGRYTLILNGEARLHQGGTEVTIRGTKGWINTEKSKGGVIDECCSANTAKAAQTK